MTTITTNFSASGFPGIAEETDEERAQRLQHERRRIGAAIRSVDEERVISLSDMQEWAASLDTDNVLPLPRARRWADRASVMGATSLADEAAESLGHIEWWFSQPGVGAAAPALRRVRALLTAIARLATTPNIGLPGEIPGTRELICQNHRIVYVLVQRDRMPGTLGAVVVFDIFGPAQP